MKNSEYNGLIKNTRKNQQKYFNPIPVVIGLVYKNDKVLVVKNDKKLKYWQLVAGFVNAGESAEQAIIREVFEETGLDVKIQNIIGTFPYKDKIIQLVIAFKLKYQSGKLKPQDDIVEARWVNINEKVTFKKDSLSEYIYSLK